MSELIVEIPDSLRHSIEELAEREGYSVSQFLASAAGDRCAVVF